VEPHSLWPLTQGLLERGLWRLCGRESPNWSLVHRPRCQAGRPYQQAPALLSERLHVKLAPNVISSSAGDPRLRCKPRDSCQQASAQLSELLHEELEANAISSSAGCSAPAQQGVRSAPAGSSAAQ